MPAGVAATHEEEEEEEDEEEEEEEDGEEEDEDDSEEEDMDIDVDDNETLDDGVSRYARCDGRTGFSASNTLFALSFPSTLSMPMSIPTPIPKSVLPPTASPAGVPLVWVRPSTLRTCGLSPTS